MDAAAFQSVEWEARSWCESVGGLYSNGKRGRICYDVKTYTQRGKFLIEDSRQDKRISVKITNYETGEVTLFAAPRIEGAESTPVHKFFYEGKW